MIRCIYYKIKDFHQDFLQEKTDIFQVLTILFGGCCKIYLLFIVYTFHRICAITMSFVKCNMCWILHSPETCFACDIHYTYTWPYKYMCAVAISITYKCVRPVRCTNFAKSKMNRDTDGCVDYSNPDFSNRDLRFTGIHLHRLLIVCYLIYRNWSTLSNFCHSEVHVCWIDTLKPTYFSRYHRVIHIMSRRFILC